jgi:hypothetical protein
MHSKKSKVTNRMGEISFGEKYGHFVASADDQIGNYAIITNASWWVDNVNSIVEWLQESGISTRYKHEGMVLTFDDKEDLALFLLRWS